ncbi:MAG: hypothetical protein ABEH81_15645 [Halopenitus sp.]
MSRPLAVDAELSLTHDGDEISVWDDDDALVVDVPSYGAARALLRTVTRMPTPPAELFDVARASAGTEDGDSPASATVASDEPSKAADQPHSSHDTAGDHHMGAVLDRHDLTVEIRVRYATVARLGADANPSGWERQLATRLLRVPAAVRLRGVVVAAARRVG